jgi:hypothetical protein
MPKGWTARKSNYFLVIFGEKYDAEHPVNRGVYPHRKGHVSGAGVAVGDVLLLVQDLEAPGIGVVVDVDTGGEPEVIYYQFFPCDPPVIWGSLDALRSAIPSLRDPLNYIGNWLQKIDSGLFRKAIAGAQIKWP